MEFDQATDTAILFVLALVGHDTVTDTRRQALQRFRREVGDPVKATKMASMALVGLGFMSAVQMLTALAPELDWDRAIAELAHKACLDANRKVEAKVFETMLAAQAAAMTAKLAQMAEDAANAKAAAESCPTGVDGLVDVNGRPL